VDLAHAALCDEADDPESAGEDVAGGERGGDRQVPPDTRRRGFEGRLGRTERLVLSSVVADHREESYCQP